MKSVEISKWIFVKSLVRLSHLPTRQQKLNITMSDENTLFLTSTFNSRKTPLHQNKCARWISTTHRLHWWRQLKFLTVSIRMINYSQTTKHCTRPNTTQSHAPKRVRVKADMQWDCGLHEATRFAANKNTRQDATVLILAPGPRLENIKVKIGACLRSLSTGDQTASSWNADIKTTQWMRDTSGD